MIDCILLQITQIDNLEDISIVFESCNVTENQYYTNYRPISLLSNIEKILVKLMYKRLYTFPNNNNIIYNLQFGFGQQYFTFIP